LPVAAPLEFEDKLEDGKKREAVWTEFESSQLMICLDADFTWGNKNISFKIASLTTTDHNKHFMNFTLIFYLI
jgi:hypothetical protein